MSLRRPASACCGHGAAAPRLEEVGHLAGLDRRGELGLERLVLEDRDVDLHVRVRGGVGVGDRLEVGLAGVTCGDVPPVDVDRAGGRRRGLRRGRGCGRRCRRGGRWGRRGWGGCGATAARTGGDHDHRGGQDTEHARARRHDSTSSCARHGDSDPPRDGRSSNVNGAAKVSVRCQIGFAANRNRPGHQRQASTFGEGRGGFPAWPRDRLVRCRNFDSLRPESFGMLTRWPSRARRHPPGEGREPRRSPTSRRWRESPCPPSRRSSTAGRTCRRRRADESRRRSGSMVTSGRRAPPVGRRCWRSSSTSSSRSGRWRSSGASSMSRASTSSRSCCPRCRAVGDRAGAGSRACSPAGPPG